MQIVYSQHYDIGFWGLERLHPFDSRKYSRAWRCLRREFGKRLQACCVSPSGPVSREDLLRVHSAEYLDSLGEPHVVARALELPLVARFPAWLVDQCVLLPMRWGVAGSMLAAECALRQGLAVNLSGGYHHAKRDHGEGFCVYSDIALMIDHLRRNSLLAPEDHVAYIDLDAHMGNGVAHLFMDDPRVRIFDMYNHTIYPSYDSSAENRIDCAVGIHAGQSSRDYLQWLQEALPGFLHLLEQSHRVGFAIYNAGTDVLAGDRLGHLNVTAADVLERDLWVIDQLRQQKIPTVMLLSGGYTRVSYRLVFNSVKQLLLRYGGLGSSDPPRRSKA